MDTTESNNSSENFEFKGERIIKAILENYGIDEHPDYKGLSAEEIALKRYGTNADQFDELIDDLGSMLDIKYDEVDDEYVYGLFDLEDKPLLCIRVGDEISNQLSIRCNRPTFLSRYYVSCVRKDEPVSALDSKLRSYFEKLEGCVIYLHTTLMWGSDHDRIKKKFFRDRGISEDIQFSRTPDDYSTSGNIEFTISEGYKLLLLPVKPNMVDHDSTGHQIMARELIEDFEENELAKE